MSVAMPPEVQAAIEHLLRTAKEYNVVVAGFAFASNPVFVSNFGTCSDMADIRLYASLCDMTIDKATKGQVIHHNIGPVQ